MIWDGKGIAYQIVTRGCTSLWRSADELKPIGYCTMPNQGSNDTKKIAWFYFWDNDFADKVELDLTNRELIQENGKWFVVKKKPVYPKTFEECCETLKVINSGMPCIMAHRLGYDVANLARLIIMREAYWKIAGEEMGLGKSWKPDWDNLSTNHEFIKIDKGCFTYSSRVLVFPTKEMRDAFYENFKDLIKKCKDLL